METLPTSITPAMWLAGAILVVAYLLIFSEVIHRSRQQLILTQQVPQFRGISAVVSQFDQSIIQRDTRTKRHFRRQDQYGIREIDGGGQDIDLFRRVTYLVGIGFQGIGGYPRSVTIAFSNRLNQGWQIVVIGQFACIS